MKLKQNWLEITIVVGILLSVFVAFYLTEGVNELEAELTGVAKSSGEVQSFLEKYPGAEAHLIRIAPKGIFSIKRGEELDPHFGNYEKDPLVEVIRGHEFGNVFPNVWIISFSPNQIRREGYVAPHPPEPVVFVFFDERRELLFTEVLE